MKLYKSIFTLLLTLSILISGCKKDINEITENKKNTPSIVIDSTKEFIDERDNNVYDYVKIGNQIWMSQNLNYKTNNGSWCYNDSNIYALKFGRLYDWYTASQNTSVREAICPKGWHIPANYEWECLINTLGGNEVAGGKMKEKGYTNWIYPNAYANDSSKFSALPCGMRYNYSFNNNSFNFTDKGTDSYFWSSSEYINSYDSYGYCVSLNYNDKKVSTTSKEKNTGLSVRCIKNNNLNITTGNMIDSRDSNIYKTVTIGNQTWMAENLKFKTSTGSWYYSNNESKYGIYGRLYDWITAVKSSYGSSAIPSGIRGICPENWHIPSKAEWDLLIYNIGGIDNAGRKMREKGNDHWNYTNAAEDNSSMFNALPAGYMDYNGNYSSDNGNIAFFWTTTPLSSNNDYVYVLELTAYSSVFFSNISKDFNYAYSVRCVKN